MYIDAPDACTTLSFNINENSLVKPKWLISVTQYTSDFNNKAPKGCLQYFFGADKGIITGLNWNSSSGKSMERNKRICIRREANRNNMEYHQAGGTEIGEGNKGINFEKYTFFLKNTSLNMICTIRNSHPPQLANTKKKMPQSSTSSIQPFLILQLMHNL